MIIIEIISIFANYLLTIAVLTKPHRMKKLTISCFIQILLIDPDIIPIPLKNSRVAIDPFAVLRAVADEYERLIHITLVYFVIALITGFLFISKIKVVKAGLKGTLICIGFGAVIFALMLIYRYVIK